MKLHAIILCILAVGDVASGADHHQFARLPSRWFLWITLTRLRIHEPGSFELLTHPI